MEQEEIQEILKNDITDLFSLIESTRQNPKERELPPHLPDYNDYKKLINVLHDNLNKYWENYNRVSYLFIKFDDFINNKLNNESIKTHELMKHFEKQGEINIYRCLNSCWLDLLKIIQEAKWHIERNQTIRKQFSK